MTDWSLKNTTFLAIITAGYIIGEIAHFLIATTSEDVANSVHYGDQVCGVRQSQKAEWSTLIGRGMSRVGSHWSRASRCCSASSLMP